MHSMGINPCVKYIVKVLPLIGQIRALPQMVSSHLVIYWVTGL